MLTMTFTKADQHLALKPFKKTENLNLEQVMVNERRDAI